MFTNTDYFFLVACSAAQTLNMEEAGSSKTFLTIYRSARRHIPGDFNLQRHRENTQTSQNLGSFLRSNDPRHYMLTHFQGRFSGSEQVRVINHVVSQYCV